MDKSELEKANSELRDKLIDAKLEGMSKDIKSILKFTEQTNSAISKVERRVEELERERNKERIDLLTKDFSAFKNSMKFWELLSTNKWISIGAGVTLYILCSYGDLATVVSKLIKLL